MKRPGIETRVTILAILMVVAVVISGFLVYRNLTQIVSSIHNRAIPDFRLIVIKDINLDLLEIENNIQLYNLTKNRSNLKQYEKVNEHLKGRLELLAGLPVEQNEMSYWNDSVKNLIETKLEIWEEIKQIHAVKNDPEEQFEELYSMLEKKEIDTIKVEVAVEPPIKKGFFKKIFGKKDTIETRVDTTFIEKTVQNEEIKEEIEQLEADLKQKEQSKNKRELDLIQQNIQVTGKLNNLIAKIEEWERDNLIHKTEEADLLAEHIYKRLSAFSVMTVVFLFVVLYLFVRYLQRSKIYKRVLTAAKQDAEHLASAKEVFIANVSHEMRTPLNAIYGITEQIIQNKISLKVKEQLGVVLKSAEHLKTVVNDTLDFSKIQAKKLNLEKVDFSPEKVFKEILDLHEPQAAAKKIELICECKNVLPHALLGDPFRLKQILINTIGNAIKFTESGNVAIRVESQAVTKSLFHLHFQIEDTGIGISKENLAFIFEDFVQVESDYTRKFSGTGLGLSIVKKLIELQDGKISIDSELNKGTLVSFHIPYKPGNPENIKEPKKHEITIPDEFRKLKILVVDDEEFNRYLLKIIFDRWGVKFYEAINGKEAVRLALEKDFDLILMDLRMPVLNGVESAKQIVKEKPASNIIAVAAVNGGTEMELCRDVGIQNFLSKPFSELDLFNTIISALKINNKKDDVETDEFELKELEGLTNGDREFMKEMILIFIRSTQSGMQNIKLALEENNWQGISEAAHKMAAPCKHIMAIDLYDKIKKLERFTNNLESIEEVPELIKSIDQKVEKINKSLSQIIESGKFDK